MTATGTCRRIICNSGTSGRRTEYRNRRHPIKASFLRAGMGVGPHDLPLLKTPRGSILASEDAGIWECQLISHGNRPRITRRQIPGVLGCSTES